MGPTQMHGVLFLYVYYFIPRTQRGWVKLAYLPPGRVLGMSLVIPVSGSFTTQPILSSKTKASLCQTCTWQCQSLLNCCQGPRTLQVGKASSPGLLNAPGDSCSLGCWAPTPQLSLVLLASAFMFPNCRMGLSSQLASLLSWPTDMPTPFTLLAPQEQPGQGLQGRRPWVTCWYRMCRILSSLRSKNAPDIGSDFKRSIPPKEPVITDAPGYFPQSLCWWLVRPRDESGDSKAMSINQLSPSNLRVCFLW